MCYIMALLEPLHGVFRHGVGCLYGGMGKRRVTPLKCVIRRGHKNNRGINPGFDVLLDRSALVLLFRILLGFSTYNPDIRPTSLNPIFEHTKKIRFFRFCIFPLF